VNVTAAGERTTLTVGAENPVTGDVYVRRNGEDTVYAVDAAKFRCMEQTKAELFGAFSPAGITASDIEALRYTLQSGEVVRLRAVSQPTGADSTAYQTVWRLADAPDAALDADRRMPCWPRWPAMSPGRTPPQTPPPAASMTRW